MTSGGNLRNVNLDDDVWDEQDYPPPYSSTTVTDDVPEDKSIGFRREYLFSVEGALKCIEIVLSLIGFVAVLAGGWTGSGFVAWTTISAFISTTILFLIIALNITPRLPGFWPVYELIYLILYTLKYFIAAIIAGVGAAGFPSIVTACAVYAVEFFKLIQAICAVAFFILLGCTNPIARRPGQVGFRYGQAICAVAFFIYLMDGIMAYKRLQAARTEQARKRAAGEGGANRRSENTFCIIF